MPDPADWTAPGIEEVAPGVHRIPLPLPNDGLRAVNVYAIVDGDGLVLVDSGWAIAEARLLLDKALGTLGCGYGDISRFLITHAHRDHFTQAIVLRREYSTPIALGAGERPSLEVLIEQDRRPLQPQLGQLRRLGADSVVNRLMAMTAGREPERFGWELPDEWLTDGELSLSSGRRLQVVETPGHTRGHVVFHDAAARLLFAGDHVLPSITPSIGFEPMLSPDPLGDFLGSLARVRAMPDARLLPAHGPVTESVHARIDALVEHHGKRLADTEAAVASGATTAFEVASILGWTRRERALVDLDLFNQMLAVAETRAHLTMLVNQGRLLRATEDDVDRYAIA